MRRFSTTILAAIILAATSMTIYYIQICFFKDVRTTEFYFLQDIAFVPIQVLIVSVVIDRFQKNKEKQAKLKKLNVVISAFFSEAGSEILELFSKFCINFEKLKQEMDIKSDWGLKSIENAVKKISTFDLEIDSRKSDLENLMSFMKEKKMLLLSLFENPNLIEHDSFTDMLWAVFHVIDELESRESLKGLPETDMDHLSGDIKRALSLLAVEWLNYMGHLKTEYPYLFSLALRKSPLSDEKHVVIGG